MNLKLLVWCACALFSVSSWAVGNIEAGKDKSANCAACHSEDGNSVTPMWPKLAGQHPNYLLKQLKEYKLGEQGPRYEPQMFGMTVNLSEEDMEDMVAYYASQTQTKGKALPDYVELGERIYRGGNHKTGVAACSSCHSPKGNGNRLANYPKLGGQHAEYTEQQIKKFRNGERTNGVNGIMSDIAKRMTEEEIKAVSEYIAGLR